MNLLQKAYDTIKEKIEFVFLKRKFNSWYETKDIDLIDNIRCVEKRILNALEEERFESAFLHYETLLSFLEEKSKLDKFKNYVLTNENDEH